MSSVANTAVSCSCPSGSHHIARSAQHAGPGHPIYDARRASWADHGCNVSLPSACLPVFDCEIAHALPEAILTEACLFLKPFTVTRMTVVTCDNL